MSDEPATDTLEPAIDQPHDVAPDGRSTPTTGTGGWSAAGRAPPSSTSTARSSPGRRRSSWAARHGPPGWCRRASSSATPGRPSCSSCAGGSDKKTDGVRDRMLGAVTGMRQDDLMALNAEVLPKLLAKIRPEARRLLDLHRRAGRSTYIVSAAPVEIVEPLALALGMTAGIGTRGEVTDGVYNGRLAGPFCYGEGKVVAMEEIARWDGLDLGQCYGYSRLGQRPADAAGGRPSGGRQPRRPPGPPRPRPRLADRPLQPAHQVGDPAQLRRPPRRPGSPAAASPPAPSTPSGGSRRRPGSERPAPSAGPSVA